jgi:hypothetical protein
VVGGPYGHDLIVGGRILDGLCGRASKLRPSITVISIALVLDRGLLAVVAGRGHHNHVFLVELMDGLVQGGRIVVEADAHIDHLGPRAAVVIDPLQAVDDVGEIASPVSIEHLHRQ